MRKKKEEELQRGITPYNAEKSSDVARTTGFFLSKQSERERNYGKCAWYLILLMV